MSDNNFPSIYIARVFPNINERKIKETFENLFSDKNCVDRVDCIKTENKKGEKYNKVFVHFKYCPKKAENMKSKLMEGETVEVVYNHPWFWKCVKSEVKKPEFTRKDKRNMPYIKEKIEIPKPKPRIVKE